MLMMLTREYEELQTLEDIQLAMEIIEPDLVEEALAKPKLEQPSQLVKELLQDVIYKQANYKGIAL